MRAILIYLNSEDSREKVKTILCDTHNLIITESIEQMLEIMKHAEIIAIITDMATEVQKSIKKASTIVVPITRPINNEDILKKIPTP